MNLSPERKIAGVLAPLFALRREHDLGIGDIAALRQFIEWAREIGFHLVQMLPINEIGGDNSPYNAISSVAIEPTTLHLAPNSPEDLSQSDFDAVIASVDLEKLRRGPVNYKRVRRLKRALLERGFENFEAHGTESRRSQFEQFCLQERVWLEPYSFFRTLMELNGEREAWDEWQPAHRSPQSARNWLDLQPSTGREQFASRARFFGYVQWIADQQWREISKFADERGVALMGDIPFGVSYYSADVFSHGDIFALDWSGGAPPEPYFKDDEFTQKWGQNWGIPVYQWEVLRRRDFDWWRQRTRGVKRIFHLFRIDHILGFYRIYAFPWRPKENPKFLPLDQEQMRARTGGREPHFVPRDDSNPEKCEANKREGEEYVRIVLSESGSTSVVGEDLGTVPDYVRPNLRSLGVAGFKIPQWEVNNEVVVPGETYESLSVATYATHDHKPIRQLWAEAHDETSPTQEQARTDLQKIAQFASIEPGEGLDYIRDFYPAMLRALFRSNSWIAVVMITDLLARKDRFNVPGTAAAGNWTRRLPATVAKLRDSRYVRRRMKLVRDLLEKTDRA
jgi:4-alpha-glucanotransferase